MGPMADVDLTMEQLDNTLDTVDELIQSLPISDINKRALVSKVYGLWMDVENIVDMELSVDTA